MAEMRAFTEARNGRCCHGFAACQVFPELDRIQAFRKRSATVRENTDIKLGYDARHACVMDLSQQPDVGLGEQSLAFHDRQLVRPAQYHLHLGSGAGQFLDEIKIKTVAMKGSKVSEDRSACLILG